MYVRGSTSCLSGKDDKGQRKPTENLHNRWNCGSISRGRMTRNCSNTNSFVGEHLRSFAQILPGTSSANGGRHPEKFARGGGWFSVASTPPVFCSVSSICRSTVTTANGRCPANLEVNMPFFGVGVADSCQFCKDYLTSHGWHKAGTCLVRCLEFLIQWCPMLCCF